MTPLDLVVRSQEGYSPCDSSDCDRKQRARGPAAEVGREATMDPSHGEPPRTNGDLAMAIFDRSDIVGVRNRLERATASGRCPSRTIDYAAHAGLPFSSPNAKPRKAYS